MSDTDKRINPAVLNGGTLIVVGVLLLLNQMGIFRLWFDFWVAAFFIIGVLKLLQSRDLQGYLWGGFLLAIAAALELDYLGYAHLRFATLWPVFVIAAGLILVLRAYQRRPEAEGVSSARLNVFAVLGGGEYHILAKNFRGGDLVALMGGFDIDLRDADIEGNEATITVNALMGGGSIRIPETWGVSMCASAFMGGHSVKAREGIQPTKILIVKGLAIMGGVEIKN
jgi:predicted membrane protein